MNANNEIIAVNDVGFVLLPNNKRYSISVFVKDSKESMEDTEKIISDISNIIYSFIIKEKSF